MSLQSKVNAYINSNKFKKKYSVQINRALTQKAELAASKMRQAILSEIKSSGLSSDAIEAVSDWDYSSPIKMINGNYSIFVYPDGDLSRPSLYAEGYPAGINDIVSLLDSGVDHKMNPVYGQWHGKRIRSRTTISGANFIDQAIQNFKGNFASDYNVITVKRTR